MPQTLNLLPITVRGLTPLFLVLCRASIVRGWEMLCLLSTTFSPSVNMEGFVHGFIQSDASSTVEDEEVASKIRIMAACPSTLNLNLSLQSRLTNSRALDLPDCLLKLKANKPARGKPPTILEIESAMVSLASPCASSLVTDFNPCCSAGCRFLPVHLWQYA